ncbi:ComF family protein [Candidatus Magnetominusculus dajiuhuensis]|uniref:ComF family protein n=1 Tax=Candidatus Magnetominusculus dajiuhuensis TaxID=3137712 RepID=UPI003B439D3F
MPSYTKIMEGILGILFPSLCPVCGRPSDELATSPICGVCWANMSRLPANVCSVCSKPLQVEGITKCGDCYAEKPFYSTVRAYARFSGAMKEAIHLFKFSGVRRLARPLAELLKKIEIPEADLIVPVPLTKKRLTERGFNQSLLLAKAISDFTQIPLSYDTLLKVKETPHQTTLRGTERVKSLRNAFRSAISVKGKKIAVVDDVMTTGATINECARALIKADALSVLGIVAARTVLE